MTPTSSESDDEWGAVADTWDDSVEVRAYAAAAFASLERLLASHGRELSGAHVCDFGCGTGLLTERLVDAGATVDAVDTSPKMLEVLRAKVTRHSLSGIRVAPTLADLDGSARPARYDLIVGSSVFGFVPDYPAVAADLASRLRSGGLFAQWDWEREPVAADQGDDDGAGLTRQEIADALRGAGLIRVDVETAFELEMGDAVMRPLLGVGWAA